MIGAIFAIAFIVGLILLACWTGRTKPSGDGGDNRHNAMRYGPGSHGGGPFG